MNNPNDQLNQEELDFLNKKNEEVSSHSGLDPASPYYQQNLDILNSPEHKARIEEQKRKIAEFKAAQKALEPSTDSMEKPELASLEPTKQVPIQTEPTKEDQPSEDPRLTKALEQQNKLELLSTLLKGFQQIGSSKAIAYGYKPEYAGSEYLSKLGQQPVEQYKTQLAREAQLKKEKREQESHTQGMKESAIKLDEFQTRLANAKLDLQDNEANLNPKSENSRLARERLIELKEKTLGRPLSDIEKKQYENLNAKQIFQYTPQLQKDVAAVYQKQLQDERLKAQKEIADKRLEAEKARNEKLDKMEERRVKREDRQEKEGERHYRQQQINTARGMLKDDPRFKKSMEQSMEFDSVNELLGEAEKGNQQAVGALGTKLARAMGEVGVLTDSDVVRYVAGQSWGRKLLDWYKKGATGELSEDTVKGIRANLKVMKEKLNKDVNKVYTGAANRMKAAYPDMSDDDIKGILGFTPPQASQGPYGETTVRNGKTYKWNPSAGKYQLVQ